MHSVNEDLVPQLREGAGLQAYYVIDAGDGIVATVTICESREAAEASSRLAAEFIRERHLTDALPNPPEVTAGEVTVQHLTAGART